MEKTDLNSFFQTINYDWEKDKADLEKICYYTKSRASQNKHAFQMTYGMEQPFLIKALAEWRDSKSFFEIGTGRGTACYAASLVSSVEKIDTIDIIPFQQKRLEAIGYEPAMVSNQDLYQMIPYVEKEKINFHERHQIGDLIKSTHKFDLLFIDGEHDNFNVIFEDFEICRLLAADDALIVWDDYYPNKFAIKDVLQKVATNYPEYELLLIESRGHLFPNKPPESNCGTVVMGKRGFYENLSS